MIAPKAIACSVLLLAFGASLAPVQAMDDAGSKMSGGMMHKTGMKKHKTHKGSMMKGDAMKGDAMDKDAAPAQ